MKKKLLGVLLAGTIVASAVATNAMTVSAAEPTNHGKYTPSAGVDTYKYYLAMPGCWINDTTKVNNDAAGVYWWSAPDDPDTKFGHGWPGYEMDKESSAENLYSINAPQKASILVFNNYLDGGMDSKQPIFKDALQAQNKNVEYYNEGDSDNYSQPFWQYMWTLAAKKLGYDVDSPDFDYTSDDLYNDVLANPDKIDFTPEFGDYGKNFFSETENESGLAMNFQNMIYIVDLDPAHIKYVNEDLIPPKGKPAYDGEFYFMYGDGEFGMWPTKELALKMEGVTQNDDGTYTGGTVDEYGFVRNADKQIVVGNFKGKYWEQKEAPTAPTSATEATSPTVQPTTGVSTPDEPSSFIKVTYDSSWTKGSGKDYELKVTSTSRYYDLSKILKTVSVGGKVVDAENYTLEPQDDGSLIVKVKASFMETLAEGENEFVLHFETEAGQKLDLKPVVKVIPAPDDNGSGSSTSDSSGDSGNGGNSDNNGAIQTGATSFVVVMLVAALGVVAFVYFKRRKAL